MVTTSLLHVTQFNGAFAYLSNFYRFTFVYRGLVFPTGEHAFQYDKTDDPAWKERIRNAGTAREAKSLGREAPMTDGWTEWKRYFSMENVLAAKFAPGSLTGQHLVYTNQAVLIEGNHWHDNDWGVCFCSNCKGQGRNLLGWMLMRQRHVLQAGGLR